MIKLIVFDMDGTILDTLEDLKNSLNFALEKNGLPPRTLDEVRRFVGNGIGKLIERGVPEGCSDALRAKVQTDFFPHYAAHCNDNTRPYNGIPEVIAALRKAGYLTAVVSNKADFAVQDLCKIWFDGLFDAAVGEREGLRRKPAPDSVFEVCRQLNTPVSEAVYVGDSEVDLQTARNAGMEVVSVEWGFRDAAFLRECGADRIVSSTAELAECFGILL
ncbi:MAG: HAD-IA family hydrolase [Clostridia bacterium]|nr:HAD-IA family hydrolase [Clostridia bacterium]